MENKYNSSNEMIGTYYKCPFCNKKITITKDGVYHLEDKHMISKSLETLYNDYIFYREYEDKIFKSIFYGIRIN